MSNRTLQLLIFLSIAAVVFLLALNLLPHFANDAGTLKVSPQGIKGSSVVFNGKTYTLNYEQQSALIEGINAAIPVATKDIDFKPMPDMGQFEIYYFNDKPTLILRPIGTSGKNLVFKIPEWNPNGLIKDVTDGKLLNLLNDSHANLK